MDFFSGPVYLPTPMEALILLLVVVELVALGHLLKRHWTDRNETVPFPMALTMWIGMIAAYCAVIYLFYRSVPVGSGVDPKLIVSGADGLERFISAEPVLDRRATVLVWCFLFWIFPMYYYISILRESFAASTVEHIGPMSAHIEDPSQFAAARKLALRGDVDGAVARYLSYSDNKSDAMFEAARLLKSEDRYESAVNMLDHIMREFASDKVVWAEAVYQLAKLKEVAMGQPGEAMDYLRRLLQRAPETRFGELASADLSRLQALSEGFSERADRRAAASEGTGSDAKKASTPSRPTGRTEEEIPDADPFYLAALQRQKAAKARQGAVGTATSVRVTGPGTSSGHGNNGAQPPEKEASAEGESPARKPAVKKKAPAKKKAAAKKPAAKAASKKKSAAKKKAPAKRKTAAKKKSTS